MGIHLRLQEQNREKSTFSNVFHQTERHSIQTVTGKRKQAMSESRMGRRWNESQKALSEKLKEKIR